MSDEGPDGAAAAEPSREDGRGSVGEPSRDEMLDNTPEAVAMRRARAARAEAAARPEASVPAPRRSRRLLLGILGAVAAAGALSRMTGRGP